MCVCMCVCVLVFRLSWWVGQCVVLAERCGGRGHDPPLPLPPPAPVWKTWWVSFFFFRCELRKCRSLTANQRRREVRTEEDAEEVEGWGSQSKGENRRHWWWRWQNSHSLSLIHHLSSNSWWIPVCLFFYLFISSSCPSDEVFPHPSASLSDISEH